MTTDVEKKVVKQVEYYFGDCNLPKDRFLQEQIKLDNGWVALETMIKFNRLRQITEDMTLIAEALKKSTSGLLEVSENGTKIRRCLQKPMPDNTEVFRRQQTARTVYAKGFPLDASLDQVQEFFEQFGDVDNVFLRRDIKKAFKGSVFVTFTTDESVRKFLEAESAKFKDQELEKRKLKTDYFKEKNEERKKFQEGKQKKKEIDSVYSETSGYSWEGERALDQASSRQQKDEEQKVENEMITGALLHFNGLSNTTTREDIKNFLQDYGPIAWVDFDKGDTECWVRYEQENKAKEVLEKVLANSDNAITLNGNKIEGRVLEGEEESKKWKQMIADIKERMQHNRNKKKDRRQGGGRFARRPPKNRRNANKPSKNDESDDGDDSDEPVRKMVKKNEEEEGD